MANFVADAVESMHAVAVRHLHCLQIACLFLYYFAYFFLFPSLNVFCARETKTGRREYIGQFRIKFIIVRAIFHSVQARQMVRV